MASGVYTHTQAHTHTNIHMKVISRNQARTGHRLAHAWFNKINNLETKGGSIKIQLHANYADAAITNYVLTTFLHKQPLN